MDSVHRPAHADDRGELDAPDGVPFTTSVEPLPDGRWLAVVNLGDGTTLVIDESVYDPNKGAASTLMHVLGGKVRALVSDYYSGGKGSFSKTSSAAPAMILSFSA